ALIATEAYGLFHATNSGSTTWCEFAREIFRLAAIDVAVQPISSAEFGAKAARPCYSVLNTRKLAGVIGFEMPPWQEALERYLADYERKP
ncbi:MAG: sugar nucleotide-binding protein, partial [Planctomycetaceae bacterium]|nr:sugar nucleotide-binding protein [Planctomycetaceae bacterium]